MADKLKREYRRMNELHEAFCPVCGHLKGNIATSPEARAESKSYTQIPLDTENFWEKTLRDFQADKPFGYIRDSSGGYGRGLPIIDILTPDKNPRLFETLKTVFLKAIKVWLDRGWIKRSEILKL